MNNLITFIKENIKMIGITILIYQILITIFFFSTENLIILATLIVVFSIAFAFATYKDDIINFFKK
jgi:hypothetical protein